MNVFKTYSLLFGLTLLLGFMGFVIDQVMKTSFLLPLFLLFGVVSNFVMFFYSDKLVLKLYKAREVSESDAPELHEMIGRLAGQAGLPKPKICVIPTPLPNAFATGRSPKHAAVAFTDGILRTLTRDELEGVAAHELAHIRNRDTLIATTAAMIAGAITAISDFLFWGSLFGGRDSENSNPLAGVLALVGMIAAPIAATLITFAISRAREFEADKTAAYLTGNPEGLASALQRLEAAARAAGPVEVNAATANLFIVSPLAGARGQRKAGAFTKFFMTHPPTEERVAALRALTRDIMTGGGAALSGRLGQMR